MKKILNLFLVLMLFVGITGCSSKSNEQTIDSESNKDIVEKEEHSEPIYFSSEEDFEKDDLNKIVTQSMLETTYHTYDKAFDGVDTIDKDGIIVKPKIKQLYLANDFYTIESIDGKVKNKQNNAMLMLIEFDCEFKEESIYYNKTDNNKFVFYDIYFAQNVYKQNNEVHIGSLTTGSSNNAATEPVYIYESMQEGDYQDTRMPFECDEITGNQVLFEVKGSVGYHAYNVDTYLSFFNEELAEPDSFVMRKLNLKY